MMLKTTVKFFALSAVFAVSSFGVFAQSQIETTSQKTQIQTANLNILPLSEVKEGMRGTARTVFRGSTPEQFNVEILGIVPGAIGPKQDMIVGRISGGEADRTSVFAGMSGSPCLLYTSPSPRD